MSCLDYINTVRANSASITSECASAIQNSLLSPCSQKRSGMSVLRSKSAEFCSCTHPLNPCISSRAHLRSWCCAEHIHDKQLLGELVSVPPLPPPCPEQQRTPYPACLPLQQLLYKFFTVHQPIGLFTRSQECIYNIPPYEAFFQTASILIKLNAIMTPCWWSRS